MNYERSFELSSGDTVYLTSDKLYPFNNFVEIEQMKNEIKDNYVSTRFRIFVLYPDESVNYEIPQEDIKLGGSYSENYQNGQRRSLSFSLLNETGKYTPNINTLWAGTRLALEVGIQMVSKDIIWFRKGVFIISSIENQYTTGTKEVAISAGDKFLIFEGNTGKLESSYEVPAGTPIKDLVHTILLGELGNSTVFDPQDFIFPEQFQDAVTQVEISQEAGSTYGEMLQTIATQLSAEIFYDSLGRLVFSPIDEVTLDNYKASLGHFKSDEGEISSFNVSIDYNNIINRVIVSGSSSAGNVYRAEAKIDDPASPFYYGRIGLRTMTLSDSAIGNDRLAQERADYELRQQAILKTSTNTSVLFNPFITVNNVIRITDSFLGLVSERFLVQSVSFSIDYSNQMSITFSNLTNLPFLTKKIK